MVRMECHVGDEHALRFTGVMTNIHEWPAVGNGDLGALVGILQNEFVLHLGKSDVWDARFDHDAREATVTQDELIKLEHTGGAAAINDAIRQRELRGWGNVHPCPKPAGRVRIVHSGFSSTRINTTIDIARGLVNTSFAIDYGAWGSGTLHIEAFVDRNANVVRLRLRGEGRVADVRIIVEKLPDALDSTLPPPEVVRDGDHAGTVTQHVPGECDVQPFAWHLAGRFAPSGKPIEAQVWRLQQACAVGDDKPVDLAVGVATERDGSGDGEADCRLRAIALAAGDYDAARAAHVESWAAFWTASGVDLGDRELEATWYRNLFALGCHIGAGAVAPGLCANVVPYEKSPWHGVYTVNMNIQKMFLPAVWTDHLEWIDCYADWLAMMRPQFEDAARRIFGIEGVYSEHMLLPFVPVARMFVSNTCGRSLGMTGWHAQPLWWRWQCTRDRVFLEAKAYPYLKSAAAFYARYLDKYMDDSGDIYPSMNLESPGWTDGFAHNRDCIVDLIMFRHTFRWAIEAAKTLGVDDDWQQRWAAALKRVRPIRYELPSGEGQRGWLARDRHEPVRDSGQPHPERDHGQAMWAAWTVFPGEYVEGDDEHCDLTRTIRSILLNMTPGEKHPDFTWIHLWWCAIPGLRLGLPGAFEHARQLILQERWPAGHAKTTHYINLQPDAWRAPEDGYLGIAATMEVLLQSQGEVLRLFPCWPRGQRAAFRGLRARGGFLVAAVWDPAEGLTARIESIASRVCRVRWRSDTPPAVTCDGDVVPIERGDDEISFPMAAGACYELRAGADTMRACSRA